MTLSSIINLDEIKAEVLRCISTELDYIHNLELKDLNLKGLTLSRQTHISQATIDNLDLPAMKSWSATTKLIKDSEIAEARLPKDTVFYSAPEVARLAKVLLKSKYSTDLGATSVDDIAICFDQNEYMAVEVVKTSNEVRNKIIMALLRSEIKTAVKEKTEFEKFKELKAKYEPNS